MSDLEDDGSGNDITNPLHSPLINENPAHDQQVAELIVRDSRPDVLRRLRRRTRTGDETKNKGKI